MLDIYRFYSSLWSFLFLKFLCSSCSSFLVLLLNILHCLQVDKTSMTFVPPENLLNTIKCIICNNILSVPPITGLSKDMYRCGRCEKGFEGKPFPRNFLYEELAAACMAFPCIYERCSDQIGWGDVEQHEKTCQFRTIDCPNCALKIEVLQLETHFREQHEQKLKYGHVFINLKAEINFIGVLVKGNHTFIVYVLKHLDLFLFCVFSTEPEQKYTTFDVTLSSEKHNGFFVSYKSQKIIPFDDRRHCYRCISKTCQLASHPYSQIYYNIMDLRSFCDFDQQSVITFENADSISCTLKIRDSSKKEFDAQVGYQNNNDLLDHHLSCSICEHYMSPPIFSCKTGHSVCSVCKVMLGQCPSCKAEFTGTRNYDLEAIAENVELPCQHKNRGCNFVGNTRRIRRHEVNCDYN